MTRQVVIKRLSSSDLTFFEHHFRNTTGAKQKAINLDKAVFVGQLFPRLEEDDVMTVTVSVLGPNGAGPQGGAWKIKIQDKNWRLGGSVLPRPDDNPGRYDALQKNDYAILEFTGDGKPTAVRGYFIAQDLPVDTPLHMAVHAQFSSRLKPNKAMEITSDDELSAVLSSVGLPQEHPAWSLVDSDMLEDAANAGIEGTRELWRRRRSRGRGVSQAELDRAKRAAERVGRLGEEHVNAWLSQQRVAGYIEDFQWVSDIDAVAPYDFTEIQGGAVFCKIDVKSTGSAFANVIHISIAELEEMAIGQERYDLYRLYGVGESMARLRVATNVGGFAQRVLGSLRHLPTGVTVDSVSVKPGQLPFGAEILIGGALDEE